MESKENMVEKIYKSRYEILDKIIIEKIKEKKNKFIKIEEIEINQESIKKQVENLIKNIEENNNIKNSIIMQEMYKQGFIDGVNLIMECKK
ncbi:MAG: hypothetical protein ACLUHC_06955 [Clostridia bacterium]